MSQENVQPWKLLIAAGHPASELGVVPVGVRALIDQADEFLVMVPTLPGRLEWLTGEIDKTREVADARLRLVLGQLEDADQRAEGVVGSDDPMVAFEDAVADFDPDHVLIAQPGRGRLAGEGFGRAGAQALRIAGDHFSSSAGATTKRSTRRPKPPGCGSRSVSALACRKH
jgi:hypothetical protein